MYTAEIVMNGVKRDCMAKVINFLAESVGQPSEAPHLHSHGQVLAFNAACGDVAPVRTPRDRRRLRSNARRGALQPDCS
jgi:hypothetical protein